MSLETVNKTSADGVNLLVSILVCYSEIGMLNFEPSDNSLKITYILNQQPAEAEFAAARKLLSDSVAAYHHLEGLTSDKFSIDISSYSGLAFLRITRDVQSLSKGELALVNALIKDLFAQRLVADMNIDDDGIIQEEIIDNMIGNVKLNKVAQKLMGIREDGRVMVFNK